MIFRLINIWCLLSIPEIGSIDLNLEGKRYCHWISLSALGYFFFRASGSAEKQTLKTYQCLGFLSVIKEPVICFTPLQRKDTFFNIISMQNCAHLPIFFESFIDDNFSVL